MTADIEKLKELGLTEYRLLIGDLLEQGEIEIVNDLLKTGFDNWFKRVFLIEESWKEIREDSNNLFD
jgi:hypothetical protein